MTLRYSAAVLAFLACAASAGAQEETENASFVGLDGAEVGAATLTSTPAGVLIDVEVSGLPAEKWVGFHFHETGSCDHQSAHESAGGHFNPGGKEHGFNAPNGPHAGDMPNQYVGADGVLRAQVLNTFVTLDEGENGVKGRALKVHGGADDYKSQPSGQAGDRLACAVVK